MRVLGSIALLAALVGGASAASFQVSFPKSIDADTVSKHKLEVGETCTIEMLPQNSKVTVEPEQLEKEAFPLNNGSCDTAKGAKPWAELFPGADKNFAFATTTSSSSLILKVPPHGDGQGFCFILRDTSTKHTTTYEVTTSGAGKTAVGVITFIGFLSSVFASMHS
ncbi:conserved hypothetical protein [Neospora caninum Liverpool]|uniref:SRS domain-containing protein n=1 Tax=Neospora caninum (strain Liverpool) TaxID=572307 RepID=F0VAQ2_NEOCL|nr:conserved hypothetical protein [Neospora caninum Liverpool]CBZ51310.1 conserved hypothetical protein [Neospora caninum Liverpool]CEL68625.1 TPA: hypothetical protein BN1204_043760 [Neospora caninum Liverpool]|eukprot:XP_003881343.1 conserved hypothetical protein [Neospora caninum Liverpool]